jgi:rubrerythrin
MVNGVGNTATASMDAFLNALCMVPGIGTPMLVWRIFQDLLVVVGASMSVQANSISAARDVVDVANEAKRKSETMSEDLKDAINEKKEEAAKAAEEAAAKAAEEAAAKAAKEAAAKAAEEAAKAAKEAAAKVPPLQGGKGKTAKRRNNIAAYARVIHRSLKRFDGMARARLSHNPKPDHKTAFNYAAMPYALKLGSSTATATATATAATNAALKPGLKPVAAN